MPVTEREPTEIELRVARAIYENAGTSTKFENVGAGNRARFFAIARAAIRAMREPTEDMGPAPGAAGVTAGEYRMASFEAVNAWRSMIDAASPPEVVPSEGGISPWLAEELKEIDRVLDEVDVSLARRTPEGS